MVDLTESMTHSIIEKGGTVCYLSTELYNYFEAADRYVLVTRNGFYSYRTFDELWNNRSGTLL